MHWAPVAHAPHEVLQAALPQRKGAHETGVGVGHAAEVPVQVGAWINVTEELHEGIPHEAVAGNNEQVPLEPDPAATEQAIHRPPSHGASQQTPFAQKLLAH